LSRQSSVFRIDRFNGPAERRGELMVRIEETHAILGRIDGCLLNHVLEQTAEEGRFDIVTLVMWRDELAYENARRTMQARYEASGFDPRAFLEAAGIKADLGTYASLPLDTAAAASRTD